MKNEDHFGQADHLKHELMYLFPFEDASSAAKHNIGEAMIINWSSNKAIDFSAMKSYVIQPQTQQSYILHEIHTSTNGNLAINAAMVKYVTFDLKAHTSQYQRFSFPPLRT
jgi:hypothetical protein